MKRIILTIAFLSVASLAPASTLVTDSFTIKIEVYCAEGKSACDFVNYHGISRKTGRAVSLVGHARHSFGQNGSHADFLGYEFVSGHTRYWVDKNGNLEITHGDRVLVSETGRWE